MENQKTPSTQIMLNYGLILAFITIIVAVANYAFGDAYDPHWSISVLNALISIAVIVFALKKLKEGNNGLLSLGQALKTGLGIALISGIVYIVYFYVFVNFIEAEYFLNLEKVAEANILENYPNMSDEQLEGALAMSKKMSSFGMISAIVMISSLFFGFIISLIAGLIMKKTEEVD
jgi:hypothetical protein